MMRIISQVDYDSMNALKGAVYGLFGAVGIEFGMLEFLIYLMLVDSILGVIKALKLGRKFSLKVLAWGLIAKMSMLSIPIVISLMGKGVDFDLNVLITVVVNIMVVNEGISCVTNILSIKSGKEYKNTDFITRLLEGLRTYLLRLINKLFKTIE